jgi:Mycothiol-dependent nitroreductase Rv2466c
VEPGHGGWSEEGVVVRVDLFVDPACWWSWLTSRWLVEVAPTRSLQVRWRPYSLLLRDGPEGLEDWKARVWGASLRAVRVMQALAADDPDGVRGFYEAVVTQGMADYNAGRAPFQELEGALEAAGLPSTYAAAADEATWDEPIRQAMAEASAVVGEGVGTPALVLHHDPPVGLLGPLVSPAPTGAEAVRLWDAVVAFTAVPGVLELSRPRPQRPKVPGLRW